MTTWSKTTELLAHLRISRPQVDIFRKEGIFKPGEHYIRKGSGPRSEMLFDLAACEQTMREMAVKNAERWTDYDADSTEGA